VGGFFFVWCGGGGFFCWGWVGVGGGGGGGGLFVILFLGLLSFTPPASAPVYCIYPALFPPRSKDDQFPPRHT